MGITVTGGITFGSGYSISDSGPGGSTSSSIFITQTSAPYINAYSWSPTGFGTKYATPVGAPSGIAYGVDITSDGQTVGIVSDASPFVAIWSWDKTSGFGTKYADPQTAVSQSGRGIAFTSANDAVAIQSTAATTSVYTWTSVTGFGTMYANPSTNIGGAGYAVAFSPDDTSIAIGHNGTPWISAYPWSSTTGFGTKYANPSTLPGSNNLSSTRAVKFSPNGQTIISVEDDAPYVYAYPWSSTTGFGTKYANPSPALAARGFGLGFTKDGNAVSIGDIQSPYILSYVWESGFGSKYADPATLPSGTGRSISYSADNSSVALAHSGAPYISVYSWSSGYGTKYASPDPALAGTVGWGVSFSPN